MRHLVPMSHTQLVLNKLFVVNLPFVEMAKLKVPSRSVKLEILNVFLQGIRWNAKRLLPRPYVMGKVKAL